MTKRENRELLLSNAEYKLKETISYFRCLYSEDNISRATYDYLYENVLYVLNNIVQDELYKGLEK